MRILPVIVAALSLSACTCETEAGLIRALTLGPQPQADMHTAARYYLCTHHYDARGGGGVTPEELARTRK